MTKDEALKLGLQLVETAEYLATDSAICGNHVKEERALIQQSKIAFEKALAQPESVQVSPLDFVTMTLEKEHWVGRPIIWAQWPNEEKNT